ncbi:carbohydrate ABC transporter permease [Cryptosporangium minutisporangium]|uniref:Carbohydrate ABC transporter permease n=1 Tax=Cryptosporangium minutisporangium TaxID=113569 RepID=A0ABP6SQM6_9ACTN
MTVRARSASAVRYLSLVAASLVVLLPMLVLVLAAFKTRDEYTRTGPFTPPRDWLNFSNFATAFDEGGMLRALWNTSVILAVALTGTVLIGSMAAYAVDRFDFRFRRTVIALFLFATLVPSVTTQVATFKVVTGLQLFNTRWAAIVLFLGTDIIAIYIFRQFIQSIPRELDEAAELDGATKFGIYWRIILPLCKPAIATVVIIKGITMYNEFYIPFLYMPDRDLAVVSTSLFRFKGPFGAEWEVISAGVLLVILPTLLVFLALQRFIYNGFTAGATK